MTENSNSRVFQNSWNTCPMYGTPKTVCEASWICTIIFSSYCALLILTELFILSNRIKKRGKHGSRQVYMEFHLHRVLRCTDTHFPPTQQKSYTCLNWWTQNLISRSLEEPGQSSKLQHRHSFSWADLKKQLQLHNPRLEFVLKNHVSFSLVLIL